MNQLYKHIIFALIVLAVSACSSDIDEPVTPPAQSTEAIAFRCNEHVASRAMLQSINTTFDVWAWKIDASSTEQAVMRHADGTPYCVDFQTGTTSWLYDGLYNQTLRFWDTSAQSYRFTAYSPRIAAGMSASVDANHRITLTNVQAHTAGTDWMIAQYLREGGSTMADTDLLDTASPVAISAISQVVPLNFHHILAQVDYRAYLVNPTEKKITSISLTSTGAPIYTRGTYVQGDVWNNGTANWTAAPGSSTTAVMSAQEEDGFDFSTATNKATSIMLASYIEMPQQFPAAGIPLTATIVTSDKTITAPVTLTGAWETNNHYVYYLAINLDKAVILVDIDVDSFKWQDGNAIYPEDVTNW